MKINKGKNACRYLRGGNGLDLHKYYTSTGVESLYFYLQSMRLKSLIGKMGHRIQENGVEFRRTLWSMKKGID